MRRARGRELDRARGLVLAALCLGALAAVAVLDGPARAVALGVALAAVGLWWGSLRLESLERSELVAELGESGPAQLVVTGPARMTSWAVRVPSEIRRFRGVRVRERVLLVLPVGRSPPRGAILETVVRVTEPREARDGGFDERAWLARQGVHVVLRGAAWRQVGRRGGVAGIGDRLRDRVERAVNRGTEGVRRALVLGVVVGEDEGLPERVREEFRASGLAHLLAVSGQNVAFIVAGVFGLGWLLRLSRAVRELLAIAAIGAYVLAVGWQPSVVRAGVAGVLASLAWLVARPRDRWHFLALGALVLLVWTPASLLEPGFQLSFVAVAGIFVGVPKVRSRLDGYPLPRGAADAVSIATVCGLATAPVVLIHFGEAPVYTVLANTLAFPAVPAVLGLGLLAAVVDPVAPGAAASLAWLAGWAAAWLELVAHVVASLPGAQIGSRTALVGALVLVGCWAAVRWSGIRISGRPAPFVLAACGSALVLLAAGWLLAAARSSPGRLRSDSGSRSSTSARETPSCSRRRALASSSTRARLRRMSHASWPGMGIRSLSALVLTHPAARSRRRRGRRDPAAACRRRARSRSRRDGARARRGDRSRCGARDGSANRPRRLRAQGRRASPPGPVAAGSRPPVGGPEPQRRRPRGLVRRDRRLPSGRCRVRRHAQAPPRPVRGAEGCSPRLGGSRARSRARMSSGRRSRSSRRVAGTTTAIRDRRRSPRSRACPVSPSTAPTSTAGWSSSPTAEASGCEPRGRVEPCPRPRTSLRRRSPSTC